MNKKIDEPRLYRAALDVFSRYGFNRARMGDVSGALDLAAGTIYRYVSDKKDLYEKCIAFGLTEWQTAASAAANKHSDPLEQLIVLMLAGFEYLKKDGSLLNILVENPDSLSISPADDPFSSVNQETILFIKGILDDGIREKCFRKMDSRLTAETFFTVYMLFIIKIYIKKEGERAWEMVTSGVEIIILGILDRSVSQDRPQQMLEKHLAPISNMFS